MQNPINVAFINLGPNNTAACSALAYAFCAARTEEATRAALPHAAGPQRAAMLELIDACGELWHCVAPRAFDTI